MPAQCGLWIIDVTCWVLVRGRADFGHSMNFTTQHDSTSLALKPFDHFDLKASSLLRTGPHKCTMWYMPLCIYIQYIYIQYIYIQYIYIYTVYIYTVYIYCINIYIYTYTYTYAHVHIHISLHKHIHIHIHVHVHIDVHVHVQIQIQIHIHIHIYNHINHRRKLRSQTSDNMDRWKAEVVRVKEEKRREEREEKRREEKRREEKGREEKREEERRSKRESLRRKKIQVREKVGKSREILQSRLAKAAGAEPAGQMRDEKLHAVAARSTFASEKAKTTSPSDHFWKLRCRKSARSCGAKHISKSKCTKNTMFGPLLEVEMSKKCTPLWREAHFEVKMCKAHHGRTTFGSSDVEKVHAVVARSTFPSQNAQNTPCSDHFWRFRCRFAWQAHGIVHLVKSEQNVRVL